MKKLIAMVLMCILMAGCTSIGGPNLKEMASKAVQVIGPTGSGSGVIINSKAKHSFVLTNEHVCIIALEAPTSVFKNKLSYRITHVKRSKEHDLCFMRVVGDLNAKTLISNSHPEMFEKLTVMGHPNGGSLVITEAILSSTGVFKIIDTDNGIPCKTVPKELLPPAYQRDFEKICKHYNGVMPDMKFFDSVIISAVVMPGSSGSPVFDEDGNLVAMVFGIRAGRDKAGYAHAVPLKYIRHFLYEEAKGLRWIEAR